MLFLFSPSVFRFVIVHFHLPTALQSFLIIVNYLIFVLLLFFNRMCIKIQQTDI